MRKIKINPKIYPLEAVYLTCYNFLERFYIKLDGDPKKEILVFFEPQKRISEKKLRKFEKEFEKELLNSTIRVMISKQNKKIRESILLTALSSALLKSHPALIESKIKQEVERKRASGFLVPWKINKKGFALPQKNA